MKVYLVVIYFISLIVTSHAQVNKSRIDKTDLKTFVKVLTSDSLQGRGTGTEGQRRAERFIAQRFQYVGLNPYSNNSYLQKFTVYQINWGQVYVKTNTTILENFVNMVFQGSITQNDETEKEVVFGGSGKDEELSQINVKDRMVLVFVDNLRSYYALNKTLSKKGASGLILANPKNEKQFESIKNTYKDHSLQTRLFLPTSDTVRNIAFQQDSIKLLNTIIIPNTAIKNICGISSKALEAKITSGNIPDVPISTVRLKFERIENVIETSNVIGVVGGRTNKTIIISAHYDHLGTIGNIRFPGADDNASGVAALLELAEHFSSIKDLQYTIMFLATSAEEAGLLGSSFHVTQPDFNPADIICNLNIDMISRVDESHENGKYLYCIGTDQSEELDQIFKKADALFDNCKIDFSLNNSKDPGGIFTRSDNYSFYEKGIPSVHFFSGFHPDYHKQTDTLDKINFKILENRVRQIAQIVEVIQSDGL